MQKIANCYEMLRPKNLVEPNMTASEILKRKNDLRAKLEQYFEEFGRFVSHDEAEIWQRQNKK